MKRRHNCWTTVRHCARFIRRLAGGQWQDRRSVTLHFSSPCFFHLTIINTVLDEAHKFLTSNEASRLNQSLANTIRLQRHLATRVIIATQEPTVIPPTILDLSSFIICHRFSSPSWCAHLAKHVNDSQSQDAESWFQQVMLLATGEGIVFSPTALVSVDDEGEVELLGGQFLKVKVRPRITRDGGQSLLAVGRTIEVLSLPDLAVPSTEPTEPPVPAVTTAPPVTPWAFGSSSLSPPFTFVASPLPPVVGNGTGQVQAARAQPAPDPTSAPQLPATPQSSHSTALTTQLSASLQPFIDCLLAKGAATRPIVLKPFRKNIYKLVGGNSRQKVSRWEELLQEAMKHEGLIQVNNMNLTKARLRELGQKKTIRLLNGGPFHYV